MGQPPARLVRRVGWYFGAERPESVFEARGAEQWSYLESVLERHGGLTGKRILDFGCGVGRMLRPAVARHPDAAFSGCDIHEASVAWLSEDLRDRAHVFESPELPPLPVADRAFDVIYSYSVFTHLVDSWSAWLLELRRALDDDGLLAVTVIGPGLDDFAGHSLSTDALAMNVAWPSNPWKDGGPWVLHSEWWLREHWGRAFEIVEFVTGDPDERAPLYCQSLVVMRKRPGEVTREELERGDPADPRELAALQRNLDWLREEIASYTSSASWRVTAPLRALGERVRTWRSARGRR